MSKTKSKKLNKKSDPKSSPTLFLVRGSPFSSDVNHQEFSLYNFVYRSTFSVFIVFILLLSFTLQGVERVYADESSEVEPAGTTEAEVIKETEVETPDPSLDEIFASENTEENVDYAVSENEDLDSVETPVVLPEETATTTLEDLNNSDEETAETSSEVATSTEEVADDSVDSSTEATTTEELVLNNLPIVSVTNSDSVFTFDKNQCTKLASGSFYCLEVDENLLQDALFSAPDSDGDLEIFLVREGAQAQITHNTMEDAAPYYDMNSNTIVWHRLVDDRYQIISYDIESETEVELTRTAENNMEPNRQGQYTVWQRWTDGGWNVILHDGEKESQITYGTKSNIAPYVHGTLLVWNTYDQNGEKQIEMFDIKTNTYVTVDDPDGMSVSNPRMVFVYDSMHPNGDVVTKGYDILAKEFINLDTLPKELPDQIPDSESTGETRALIQTKPTVKSEGAEAIDIGNASSTGPVTDTVLSTESATTTGAMTLDMTSGETASSTIVTLPLPEIDTSLAEFDLVIPPLSEATNLATENGEE